MRNICDTKKFLDANHETIKSQRELKELRIDIIIKEKDVKTKIKRYVYSFFSFFASMLP